MQNLTQVTFSDSSRNNSVETDDIPFRGAYVTTPEGTVRPSRIDTASGSTRYRRTETPILAEVMGYVHTNPEDAIITSLDSDFVEGIKDEEEPYVRPEPYVRRKRASRVRMVSIGESGRKVLTPDQQPVAAEPVQEAKASEPEPQPAVEAEPMKARPSARPVVRDVVGTGSPRKQFRPAFGRPRLQARPRPQPKARPRPMARPQPKVQAKPGTYRMCASEKCNTEFLPPPNAPNADLCRTCHQREMQKRPKRTCKCGQSFRAPLTAPDATLCRDCYKKEREQEKRQQQAARSLECERQARKDLELRIKRAIAGSGFLPEGAVISRDEGRQVIVLYKGESFTVYRPKTKKARRS